MKANCIFKIDTSVTTETSPGFPYSWSFKFLSKESCYLFPFRRRRSFRTPLHQWFSTGRFCLPRDKRQDVKAFLSPIRWVGMVAMLLASTGESPVLLENIPQCATWNSLAPRGSPVEVGKTYSKPFAHPSFIILIMALLIWCSKLSSVHWFHTCVLKSVCVKLTMLSPLEKAERI